MPRLLKSGAAAAAAAAGAAPSSETSSETSSSFSYRRYDLSKHLGSGSFGEIYLALDKVSGTRVAIKVESRDIKNPQLRHEFKLYETHLAGRVGFPEVFDMLSSSSHNYFTMTLLGPSLETLLDRTKNNRFSEKTTAMLAIQLLERLETFHDATGHAHR